MIDKKMLVLGVATLVMGLTSCGGGGKAADLTYWCPAGDNAIMDTLVAKFKEAYPDYAEKNIKRAGNYGEDSVYAQLHKDLDAAADVALIADDQIRTGVKAEELTKFDAEDVARVTASDGAGAVAAVSTATGMYGLPYRADNAPMPFYDSSFFTTAPTKLEDILSQAKAAGKKVYMDMGNGWYNAFFLWNGGAEFGISSDNKVYTNAADAGVIDGVAALLDGMKSLYNTYKDVWESNSDTSKIQAGFKAGSIVYAFCWNDPLIFASKDTVKVTSWPSVTIDGVENKLDCFQGYKAVICKYQEAGERLTLAKEFARFLSSETAQELRATELKQGPSNNAVFARHATELPFAGPVGAMALEGRTHGQATSVTSDFWDPMGALGGVVINGKDNWGTYNSAKAAIRALVSTNGWTNKR